MPTYDDVAALIAELPATEDGVRHGTRTWRVAGKAFAWERPYSKADLRRFGDATPPDGPLLAVRVADLDAKEALLSEQRPGVFTIPHFDHYAAVLVQLDVASADDVHDLVNDAWLACAPPSVAVAYDRIDGSDG